MTHDWTDLHAPSLGEMARLAQASFDALPPEIRSAAGSVELHIEEFADESTLDDLGIDNPFELSGLYDGVDRIHASVFDPIPHVSRIRLFRRPILDEWAERGDISLGELIAHVLIHEIGHHMGLSDNDIYTIESGPE